VKTRLLGELEVSGLGLGCMGMSEFYGATDESEAIRAIHAALDRGVTLLDTADVYGLGANERLVGKALAGRRDGVVVASKFGNVRTETGAFVGIDGSPEYVRRACDASLQRLGIDRIDLYQQHRVDPKVPIEETVGAMHELVEAGKVRFLGLSEAQAPDVERAAATAPIASVQSEYAVFTRDVERNGVLDACEALGIGLLAYAPLGRGLLTGRFRTPADFADGDTRGDGRYPRLSAEHFAHNVALAGVVEEIAAERDISPAVVALAWLLARRTFVVPIPGTKRAAYVEDNVRAADLELSAAELARLESVPDARGPRYSGSVQPGWVSPLPGA
jgi:aryl-alcohol dehydrogenase-like predicted oxidoreductase